MSSSRSRAARGIGSKPPPVWPSGPLMAELDDVPGCRRAGGVRAGVVSWVWAEQRRDLTVDRRLEQGSAAVRGPAALLLFVEGHHDHLDQPRRAGALAKRC